MLLSNSERYIESQWRMPQNLQFLTGFFWAEYRPFMRSLKQNIKILAKAERRLFKDTRKAYDIISKEIPAFQGELEKAKANDARKKNLKTLLDFYLTFGNNLKIVDDNINNLLKSLRYGYAHGEQLPNVKGSLNISIREAAFSSKSAEDHIKDSLSALTEVQNVLVKLAQDLLKTNGTLQKALGTLAQNRKRVNQYRVAYALLQLLEQIRTASIPTVVNFIKNTYTIGEGLSRVISRGVGAAEEGALVLNKTNLVVEIPRVIDGLMRAFDSIPEGKISEKDQGIENEIETSEEIFEPLKVNLLNVVNKIPEEGVPDSSVILKEVEDILNSFILIQKGHSFGSRVKTMLMGTFKKVFPEVQKVQAPQVEGLQSTPASVKSTRRKLISQRV